MKQELILKLNSLNLEMVEYNLDKNLNYDEEYMENVLSAFMDGLELDTAIDEMHDRFVDTGFNSLVESSKYIEDDINTYLRDIGAEEFRDALIGGQCVYYTRQVRKNQSSFYTNAIVQYINNIKEDILNKDVKDELSLPKELEIVLFDEPMDVIEEFVIDVISNSGYYLPLATISETMSKFNEFINSKKEEL